MIKLKKLLLENNIAICPKCNNKINYIEIKESGMGYINCPICSSPITQKNINEEQTPQLFSQTIYRIPTDEELMELGKFNLSGHDVLNGIGYIIIGRGIKNKENSKQVLQTMKRVTELFPNDESYAAAYEHAKTKFGNRNPINIDKLKQYAKGIEICCNGEYGQVFYNEKENKVFVCLGDSNPFDTESLYYYMLEAIKDTHWVEDSQIDITIENEAGPDIFSGEWRLYDADKNDFVIHNIY